MVSENRHDYSNHPTSCLLRVEKNQAHSHCALEKEIIHVANSVSEGTQWPGVTLCHNLYIMGLQATVKLGEREGMEKGKRGRGRQRVRKREVDRHGGRHDTLKD